MFYGRKVLVILQLLIVLPFATNELWTKAKVKANANAVRPFLHIERPNITHLMITQPRQPHYLACNATIEPSYYHSDTQYYFTWYRNDNSLHLNDFIIYRNGTLRLPPKEKATGVYRCKINADTNAIISESITVEYPVLRKLRTSVNYTATVGLPLTLNCPIQSIPPANISWYYGNVSLSKVFKDNSYLILSNGSLVLRSVQLSQAGKFKCLAYNLYALKAHHRQFIITVYVLDKRPGEKAPSRSDELLPPLQDAQLYVPLNGDLNLSCSTVNDNVAIEWWFQHNTTSPMVKLMNNSREYHIRSSIEEYEGNYTCRTTTDKQTFRIIVTKPPLIVKDLPVDEANIASSKTFSCLADGNPPPTISWYHNGEPFNSSYTRYVNANQLHIPSFDPQESGIYQCFARNIAGEVYTAGELRLRNQSEVINNPLKNIKCYPHTFNSINVTFENQASESLYIVYLVHIGVSEPFRWMSPYPPMKLNASYVIIELPHVENLPYIRPFQIITRVLIPTSDIRISNKPQQQTVLSTLRSLPVTCCTQGLPSRFIHIGNDTFVTWSVPDLATKKYFIIQFVINQTSPNPEELRRQSLNGTVQHINLTQEDIMQKLQTIEVVNYTETNRVLQNALSNYRNNSNSNEVNNAAEEIFSLVIPAHITGIMLRNFTRLKLRVLVITAENEHLAQDYRYVEWKMMENDTDAVWTAPYRLTIIESRMLRFHFDDNLSERCVLICYLQIHYPRLVRGERKCEQRNISGEDHSQLEIRTLKPTTHYSLHFSSCDAKIFYGQYDVVTLPDPPGPISNQRVTRHNGLKLSWDPPLQPNGKIHHYNILWSLGNVTHEANVFECSICYYKFPNISETAKINVSVRVVGETGVGAPIYIDLRNIDHRSLENEISKTNSDIYTGIAVGCFLSILCIFTFAILIMVQRKRFMARQQGPSHLRPVTDINFGNLSNTSMAADNIDGVGGGGGGGGVGVGVGLTTNTMPTDCHEMQTLIPRLTGCPTNILSATSIVQHLPNGHTNTHKNKNKNKIMNDKETINTTILSEFEMISDHNLSVVPLYKSSPPPKIKHIVVSQEVHSKPFFIPFKNPPTHHIMAIQQHKQSSFSPVVNKPPSSLPFAASPLEVAAYDACGGGDSRARRSNSLSSNSNGSSSASSSHKSKQFRTNFPKRAKSIDGICLLAEEEASTGITPTSDIDIHVELYNNSDNGFKKRTTQQKTVKPEHGVSNKQKQQQQQSSKFISNNNSNTEIYKKATTTATTTIAIITPTSTNTAIDSEYNEKEKCYIELAAATTTTTTATKANLYTSNAAILLNTASKLSDAHYQPPDMDPNG